MYEYSRTQRKWLMVNNELVCVTDVVHARLNTSEMHKGKSEVLFVNGVTKTVAVTPRDIFEALNDDKPK